MTCDDCCSKAQDSLEKVAFVRVGKSNVMIVGCREHLKQLLDTYLLGLKREKKWTYISREEDKK